MYEDTPDDIVHDLLSKAIYENHSLGYPILGTEETLSNIYWRYAKRIYA